MTPKYIKDKNGKFAGSIPNPPATPPTSNTLPEPPISPETITPQRVERGIEWVVTLRLEDGTTVRGVQKAMYGHPAIEFFAKKHNLTYKSASSEKKMHFDRFLEQGLRQPLSDSDLQ